jgi:hypothetical protein
MFLELIPLKKKTIKQTMSNVTTDKKALVTVN